MLEKLLKYFVLQSILDNSREDVDWGKIETDRDSIAEEIEKSSEYKALYQKLEAEYTFPEDEEGPQD